MTDMSQVGAARTCLQRMAEVIAKVQTTDPVTASSTGLGDYEQAVASYLAQPNPQSWARVADCHRQIARDALPAAGACASALAAMGAVLPEGDAMDAATAVFRDLAAAFDRAQQAERMAHARLTRAFAQKIRELDALLDSLPAMAYLKDREQVYSGVNQQFCTAVGRPRSEVIGRTDEDLFPPYLAEHLRRNDRKTLEQKATIEVEERLAIGGEERIIMVVRAPTLDATGAATGLVGVGVDITERKHMEERLQLLAAALDAIAEGVVLTDAAGDISWVNSAFEQVTGHRPRDARGETLRLLLPPAGGDSLFERLQETIGHEETWKASFANERPRGGRYICQQAVSPVRGPEGAVQGFVGVVADVTEQHRLAESVHRAALIKNEFTAMVSHELRTPLTAIKEAVEVVEDGTAGPLNDHQSEFLALAKRNVDRLHRVINNTLDFSKLERGEFDMSPRDGVDLLNLLKEMQAQYAMSAKAAGVQIQIESPSRIPPMTLDPDRLCQVLTNLIANAIRYGGPGIVTMRTELGTDEVVVEVRDNGPGIEAEQRERIFSPYVQLSTGPGRAVGGTGLGLAISKRIVDLHGGRIWVDSAPGGGASFFFALPTRHRAVAPDQRSHADSNI